MILRILIVILGLSYTAVDGVPNSTTPALLLSPYIKQQKLQQARNDSLVTPSLFLNVTSYSGFLTVNETYNSNLFFWYFPVAEKPVNETPWIIWLQGGPGASSLAGLFDEIGPFQYENGTLKPRASSWGNIYSLLFIDNPVGSGFSYTNSKDGFVKNVDTCASHLYSAVQQFLTIFPELRPAPLYVAGESYAGRYVPAFGFKIHQEQPKGNNTVNFKGVMMGNPIIDRIDMANLSSVYYHWGLIDSQGLLATKPLQDQYFRAINENNVAKAYELRTKLLDLLDGITQQTLTYNILKGPGDLYGFETYLDQADVKLALHVGSIQFTFSNTSVNDALMDDFLGPIRPKLEQLLEHYKVMVYCGQLDLTAPCELGAAARRERWRWSGREDFLKAPRLPWMHNDTIAGHVKKGGGLTEVLVRGAGHLVPIDAPAAARALLQHFISDAPFPTPVGYKDKPEYTPEYIDAEQPTKKEDKTNTPLIASVIVNVILIICLIGGVFIYLRYKRRSEAFFYSTVEDSISDGILTMT
ncbi:venom serine carboxypeptidase-like [Choristoneura fumiferana]|uniref:venom serine carboxypeptidase-like n=1 Tax=Choristoneura fumiferana TaxID=7141 RepID=UPI003D15CF65